MTNEEKIKANSTEDFVEKCHVCGKEFDTKSLKKVQITDINDELYIVSKVGILDNETVCLCSDCILSYITGLLDAIDTRCGYHSYKFIEQIDTQEAAK